MGGDYVERFIVRRRLSAAARSELTLRQCHLPWSRKLGGSRRDPSTQHVRCASKAGRARPAYPRMHRVVGDDRRGERARKRRRGDVAPPV
jgi:hypothetical protein